MSETCRYRRIHGEKDAGRPRWRGDGGISSEFTPVSLGRLYRVVGSNTKTEPVYIWQATALPTSFPPVASTIRWPVIEVQATVTVFENGNRFTLNAHRITKPRSAAPSKSTSRKVEEETTSFVS